MGPASGLWRRAHAERLRRIVQDKIGVEARLLFHRPAALQLQFLGEGRQHLFAQALLVEFFGLGSFGYCERIGPDLKRVPALGIREA